MKRIEWSSDDNAIVDLSSEQLSLLGESYNYPNFIADAAELPSDTVNPHLGRGYNFEGLSNRDAWDHIVRWPAYGGGFGAFATLPSLQHHLV